MLRNSGLLALVCIMTVILGVNAAWCADPASFSGSIDFLVWGDPTSDQIDKAVIAAFEAKYPNVKVNLINSGSQHNEKLLTMIAAGTPPDIAIIDSYYIADHAYKGTIMDVTDWARRDGIRGTDIVPGYWQEMTVDGRLYSVANVRSGALIMIFNQTAMNEVGVPSPSAVTWTWDDLLSAAKRLTRDTNNDGVIDFYTIDPAEWALWPWIWMAGGEFFNSSRTRTALEEPNAMRGLQFVADLYLKGYASNGEILDGKRAIKVDWPTTRIATYREQAGFEWDIALLPAGPAGQITAVKGNPVCIPATAKNKELAWEFMKFLGGEEAQYIYGSLGRFFPNHRRAGQRLVAEARASNLPPANLLLLVSNINTRPLPYVPGFGDVRELVRAEMRPVWRGERSVQEAALIIGDRSEALLAEARKR